MSKKSRSGLISIASTLMLATGVAHAVTPFEQDVATAIDRGLGFLQAQGVYTNNNFLPYGAGGLAMEALLEKRPSGNPADPPQGYTGANNNDKGYLRSGARHIINGAASTNWLAYSLGQSIFALAGYALTGGPDRSTLNGTYGLGAATTIKVAMDAMVDSALAGQHTPAHTHGGRVGYWCYGPYHGYMSCDDSSTTQFMAAGLHAARTFYLSNKSGDSPYADPARAALIDTALGYAKTAYETNASTGSNNGTCGVVSATERGHGYNVGDIPSLQQTASGVYIQLFGGSTVNTPMVQKYMEWSRNHYRYSSLDSMGNSWPSESWSYYLWSSFKGMELIRQNLATVPVTAGNIDPNSMGTLPAASGGCAVREANKIPGALPRVPSFGAGLVGYYNAEPKSQYFDYAHQIISLQCANGSFTCNTSDGINTYTLPGYWDQTAHNAYSLLVLLRATGNVILRCDVNGDNKIDRTDIALIRGVMGQTVQPNDPRDANADGVISTFDVRQCTLQCTKANCAP